MTAMSHHREACRLCDSRDLELVVPITPTPLADAYVTEAESTLPQPVFPLDLYQCRACGHVQLLDVVEPGAIFRHYSYFSGRSPGLVRHFRDYADQVLAATNPPDGSLIVEIGSNDGTFLRMFQERGMRGLGIDPAENVAQVANAAGIETWPVFFDAPTVDRILATHGPAQIVAANNVFAHTDDMAGMTAAIARLLSDDGVFVFEVSYLLDVIDHLLIGTIFHEHTGYHSVHPLEVFLARHGLELIDVQRVSIQGGSLIGTAQKCGGPRQGTGTVAALKAIEIERRLHEPATVRTLSTRLDELGRQTSALLRRWHSEGKSIAGFGAARGGTLILHHFGIGELLEFLVDDSPDKQGLFSPGHHIPVLPTSALRERRPDLVFILAWVHTRPIVQNYQWYREQGGCFVSCFPQLETFGPL